MWADVEIAGDGSGRITFTLSKTDQEVAGEVIAVTRSTMQTLVEIRDGDDELVFDMSESTLAPRVKARTAVAGLGSKFSGHIGRAVLA